MGDFKDEMRKILEKSVPWVGRYIFVASVICVLAMAADAFAGFRRKKLWFPCRYFSLDATSLTLLAAAMKLPMDLVSVMTESPQDFFSKICSIIFMSTAMSNFIASLGSMSNKEVLSSVVALVILVGTIFVDLLFQIILLWNSKITMKTDDGKTSVFEIGTLFSSIIAVATILMLLSLAPLVSLAITVPTTKRCLEFKYQEKHRAALEREEEFNRREAFKSDERRREMMKYWVMAETSNPQFVLARSVVSTTSAVLCLLGAAALVYFYIYFEVVQISYNDSPYKETTTWILCAQTVGVAVGAIAPLFRWFVVVSFKCSATSKSFKEGMKIEPYWIQTLTDWRDSFSALQINRFDRLRKYLHDAKWFAVTFCIGIQILIVVLSKLLASLSALLVAPFFTRIKKQEQNEARDDEYLKHLRSFVLLLDDEPELPTRFLTKIYREVDNMIQTGRKKQPRSLLDLLKKLSDFSGVGEFDSNQIPCLFSPEPPNHWTLPVVTLTSIAIALPNIEKNRVGKLLKGVSEGLSFVKLVERTMVQDAQLVNIRKAADVCWVGVVLYTKWLDIDLRKISRNCKISKEVLQELSMKAEGIIREFKKGKFDPQNLPSKVVAANSMYRISQNLSLSCVEHSGEVLFEQISVMIADILGACLTNLPHVITTMCHHNAIETREKSVRQAFLLLGETEQIVQVLQDPKVEWPFQDHDKAAFIEEWRAFFQQKSGDSAVLAAPMASSNEKHLAVEIDS